jgi:DNA-binding NarL/FixJ family response regulator
MTVMICSIVIVEDQPQVAAWMQEICQKVFPEALIACAGTLAKATDMLKALPDLLITDLSLPDGRGHTLIPQLKRRRPDIICVVFTSFDDNSYLFPALQAGADGYLLKDQPESELQLQLGNILQGKPPLSPSIAWKLLHFFKEPQQIEQVTLTQREQDTLALIAKGCSVKETAELLQLSHHTVSDYIKKIYRKLQIRSRAEAAMVASRMGIH